jgi:hypothetical protein
MRLNNSVLVFLIALTLFHVTKKRVFDEYKSVGDLWHKDSVVSFNLPLLDSTKRYNFLLILETITTIQQS